MPDAQSLSGSKRRRQANSSQETRPQKRPRENAPPTESPALLKPHEALLAELAPKYDVLAASVISSTQIRKRVARATSHLLGTAAGKPRAVLLHARTADVCKMITVVECCKRVLVEEGKGWYQYNQLFDLPKTAEKEDVVEETVLEKDEGKQVAEDDSDDSDDDDFEVMQSRFENAVLPPQPTHIIKSLRIIVSTTPLPELKALGNVAVQASDEAKS